MPEEIITDESLTPDLGDGGAADPTEGGNVSDSLTLAELEQHLGKQFPTKEAALKAFKDTFAYVGKKMEDVKKELQSQLDPSTFASKEELQKTRDELYYSKHPELDSYKSLIEDMRKPGETIDQVVSKDTFKGIFDKVKAHDEMQKSKSVLQSNPRLGQVTDKISQAREALSKGDTNTASKNAISAVLDAYEM